MQVSWQGRPVDRTPDPRDVSDEEWAVVAPSLARCREEPPQRGYDLREVFNALRWMVRTGTQWRYLPNHCPPWAAVEQQTRRGIAAGVFAAMVHDLRALPASSEALPAVLTEARSASVLAHLDLGPAANAVGTEVGTNDSAVGIEDSDGTVSR